jgi:tRNA 2-thiouridine synthesizing protein A
MASAVGLHWKGANGASEEAIQNLLRSFSMEKAIRVDARGLSCPQPALMTRQALQSAMGGTVQVWLDSESARDNVTRLAQKMGWKIMIKGGSGCIIIELTK